MGLYMVKESFNVITELGQKEPFSFDRFEKSLKKAGLSINQIHQVLETIKPELSNGITTKELYAKSFKEIKKLDKRCASLYSLKKAVQRMGPTGFPFEQLVGQILIHEGYDVKVGVVLQGKCITHEIDVVAYKNNKYSLVEVKFSQYNIYSTVQTVLYIKARFDDINFVKNGSLDRSILITNTSFTDQARDFGKCVNIELIGWNFPANRDLEYLIKKNRLFPVTALVSISNSIKRKLLDQNIVICKQVLENKGVLERLGISKNLADQIYNDCKSLCDYKH